MPSRTLGRRQVAGSYPDEAMPVTADEVCTFARTLPRSSEAFVRGRVKFRIGSIVYLSLSTDGSKMPGNCSMIIFLSADGSTMGFGFPKEWRQIQVDAEPEKFSLPGESDLRFHWLHVRLATIDADEMRELVEGAWAMCVPKYVAAEYAAAQRWLELASEPEPRE